MPNQPDFIELKSEARRSRGKPAQRSARLPRFIGCSVDANAVLSGLKIGVVGSGSVGGRIITHLARLKPAALWIADPKSYKEESCLTHEIEPRDVGRSKAFVTARRCKAISPGTCVFVFDGLVQDLPMDAFADADLVVMAPDNLPAEREVGQRCLHLGKNLVHASLHGETLTAQIRFFGITGEQGVCPACLFSSEEWSMSQQTQFSCEGFLDGKTDLHLGELPTVSVGSICSLAADLALNQILRFVLKLGEPVENSLAEYCGFTNRIVTSRLVQNPDCHCEHSRYSIASSLKPLAASTLCDLANAAGIPAYSAALAFTVDGYDWIEAGTCKCPEPSPVHRFVARATRKNLGCAKCRAPIKTTPFFTQRSVAAHSLGPALNQPLDMLGVASTHCVLVSTSDNAVLIRRPANPQVVHAPTCTTRATRQPPRWQIQNGRTPK